MKLFKKGKSKKKSKKAKKVEVDPNALTEVDKTFYELQIADLNKKLTRLRSLSTNLEDKNSELRQNLQCIDEDRADVISYLQNVIRKNHAEIEELQNKLIATFDEQNEERRQVQSQITKLNEDNTKMQEQLNADINVLTGKLNALEEFRIQRDELYKQFDEQEKKLKQQEEEHKDELYKVNKELLRDKDKLRNEMKQQLVKLSNEFEEITDTRIATSTHRVIEENIALNNTSQSILMENKRLYYENIDMKKQNQARKLSLDLEEKEKNMLLHKNNTQGKLLEHLTRKHEEALKQIASYAKIIEDTKKTSSKLIESQSKINKLENQIRFLQQNIHVVKCESVQYKQDLRNKTEEVDELRDVINKTVDSIKTTLEMKDISIKDEAFVVFTRENFLSKLLLLLEKSRKQLVSNISEESVECIYELGDVGFTPKNN